MITADGKSRITAVKAVKHIRINAAKLYPNPAQASVTMELIFDTKDNAFVSISDANGKIVYQQHNYHIVEGENKLYASTQTLSNGAYVVKILFQNGLLIQRFIKQ